MRTDLEDVLVKALTSTRLNKIIKIIRFKTESVTLLTSQQS